MFEKEFILKRIGLRRVERLGRIREWKGHGRKKPNHAFRNWCGQAQLLAQQRASGQYHLPIMGGQLVPSTRKKRGHKANRLGEHKKRGGVSRPRPIELQLKARPIFSQTIRPVADGEGAYCILLIGSDIKESCALGSTQPFMAISCVIRSSQRLEVEWDHTRGMCTINQSVNASFCESRNESFDRKNESALARDMIQ